VEYSTIVAAIDQLRAETTNRQVSYYPRYEESPLDKISRSATMKIPGFSIPTLRRSRRIP
jgi:hypothetical protein